MQGIDDFFSRLNSNSLSLTMIFTLVLAVATIALAYVSYLQVRASYRAISESRLQRKIEKHNEELKKLIITWRENIPKTPTTGLEIYKFYKLFLEDNPLFQDLESHLLPKYKNLMEKWENTKGLYQKYQEVQQKIISEITSLISNKLRTEYNFPPQSVHLKAIEMLTGNIYSKYDKKGVAQLYYESIFGSFSYLLSQKDAGFTEEELQKIIESHENISLIIKKEYENDIRTLIHIENEIKEAVKEIKDSLLDLTNYPEYSNMTCEYIFPK